MTTFPVGSPTFPLKLHSRKRPDPSIGPLVRVNGEEYRCRRLILREPHRDAGGRCHIFYPEELLEGSDRRRGTAVAPRSSFRPWCGRADLRNRPATRGPDSRSSGETHAPDRGRRFLADAPAVCERRTPRVDRVRQRHGRPPGQAATRRSNARSDYRLTSQLAGGLAHQLRNGVTGAKLAVQVYLSEHPAEETEALDVTLRQFEPDGSESPPFIDLGRPAAANAACSLTHILSDVVELHRPRCKHAGIGLEWESAAGSFSLVADAAQLGDMLGNLVGNAVDAVGMRGDIAITLRAASDCLVVEVSDTGPGPSPDLALRLFEPVRRSPASREGIGRACGRGTPPGQQWPGPSPAPWRRIFRVELPHLREA